MALSDFLDEMGFHGIANNIRHKDLEKQELSDDYAIAHKGLITEVLRSGDSQAMEGLNQDFHEWANQHQAQGDKETYEHEHSQELTGHSVDFVKLKVREHEREAEVVSGAGNIIEDLIGDVKKDKEYNRTLF